MPIACRSNLKYLIVTEMFQIKNPLWVIAKEDFNYDLVSITLRLEF